MIIWNSVKIFLRAMVAPGKSLTFLFITAFSNVANCHEGRFVNPVTDICWDCLFPITMSGVNVTPGHEQVSPSDKRYCFCSGTPPKAGLPLSVWERLYLVDVTRHAYKLLSLGGLSIGKESVRNRGTVGMVGDGPARYSFYHVHVYKFPILSWMEMFSSFRCLDKGALRLEYLSEFDPQWNDDTLAAILNPEAFLFGSALAQEACIADCIATSFEKPLDALFWCAGCQGSLYPFTGTVAHHVGAIQASALLVHRVIAKMHRLSLFRGFEKDNFCEPTYQPIIRKSQYKIQLVHPKAQKKGPCPSLGGTDVIWGAGKSFPYKGEDFIYLVWRKRQCCLDAIKPAVKAIGTI